MSKRKRSTSVVVGVPAVLVEASLGVREVTTKTKETTTTGTKKRKKDPATRRGYKKSCYVCRRDHKACDGGRPCENCLHAHKESECVDAPPYLYKMRKPRSTKFFVLNQHSFVAASSPEQPLRIPIPTRSSIPVPAQEPIIPKEAVPPPAVKASCVPKSSQATSDTSLMEQVESLCSAISQLREERGVLCSQLTIMQQQQEELLTCLAAEKRPPSSRGKPRRRAEDRAIERKQLELRRISALCNPVDFVPFSVPSASYPFVILSFTPINPISPQERYIARYSLANDEFCRLFDFTMEELGSVDPRSLSSDEAHQQQLETKLRPYFEPGAWKGEVSPIVYCNGRYRNVPGTTSFHAFLTLQIFYNEGTPSFLVVCFTDTTHFLTSTSPISPRWYLPGPCLLAPRIQHQPICGTEADQQQQQAQQDDIPSTPVLPDYITPPSPAFTGEITLDDILWQADALPTFFDAIEEM